MANNNTNTKLFDDLELLGKKTAEKKSEFYLNVLFKLDNEFVALNYGIGLDTMPNSNAPKSLASKQDFIRDLILKKYAELKPGEAKIAYESDILQLEVRRKGASTASTEPVDEQLAETFLKMLL